MQHTLHSLFKKTAEYVVPPLNKSQFEDKGVLTPDEFVAAGDFLVRACPTWSWGSGDPKKKKSYLPADKQFLVTSNVPCMQRAAEMESYNPESEFALGGDEDGWTATHRDPALAQPTNDDIPTLEDPSEQEGKGEEGEDDDVPDISELDMNDDETILPAPRGGYMRTEEPEETIVKTRTYDLYITYDQYYQVPRFWLVGYDETRHPLMPTQVLEDVSEDHARKTITVDPHPHLSMSAASIHPCRHAEVMKKLVDQLMSGGHEFEIQHYLVLFLKFIASVVPTIQYDYTMSIG